MEYVSQQGLLHTFTSGGRQRKLFHALSALTFHHIALLLITVLLLLGSFWISWQQSDVYASANNSACDWYRVHHGDTLTAIAMHHHSNIHEIARANAIHNLNYIRSGRLICIPRVRRAAQNGNSGLYPNGTVKWYAYNALQSSSRKEVETQLRRAAARHHLPASLLLAIAWQESGWTQHVIARDGGIGVMQVMPYTAMSLNAMVRAHHDPYKLSGNIELGAIYLQTLWKNFHGNQAKVISAYNEGGWCVVHRGILNWRYVHSVQALTRRYR